VPRVPLIDRLLLWLFAVARRLFFLQGLAFGCAAAAAFAWTGTSAPSWAARALALCGLLSGAFVAAALNRRPDLRRLHRHAAVVA
jgi:hypothetical protein